MKLDHIAPDSDLSSIPREFRENYRFLTELISCKDKNDGVAAKVEGVLEKRLGRMRGKLNRRQAKLLKDFLSSGEDEGLEAFAPPVPAELEASLRIRKRSTWLPWEAEAIRKIERWRADLLAIAEVWQDGAGGGKLPECLSVLSLNSA
jgi:hypothetical protein